MDIARSVTRAPGVIEVWPLDLASFESVREFCKRADRLDRLDVVVENASVAMVSPQGTLAEGYERTITVNVISTFLMALLLLPTLRKTASKFNIQPRLVVVSSDAHFMVSLNPFRVPLSLSWQYKHMGQVLTLPQRQASKNEHRHESLTPSSPTQFPRTDTKPPSCFSFLPSASSPRT